MVNRGSHLKAVESPLPTGLDQIGFETTQESLSKTCTQLCPSLASIDQVRSTALLEASE
jgi:hypothetical protein